MMMLLAPLKKHKTKDSVYLLSTNE
jgi:hypothetical protein